MTLEFLGHKHQNLCLTENKMLMVPTNLCYFLGQQVFYKGWLIQCILVNSLGLWNIHYFVTITIWHSSLFSNVPFCIWEVVDYVKGDIPTPTKMLKMVCYAKYDIIKLVGFFNSLIMPPGLSMNGGKTKTKKQTQVDSDGYSLSLMDSIIDHQRDLSQAIPMEDKHFTTKSRQKQLRKTTKGWKLLIKWKDKSKAWINLADLKEVHLVETAEYTRARGISDEPAFAWWVPYTLRKREVIFAVVKNQIRKMTHKYGIEIPRDVEHAHEIDSRNGNAETR